MVPGVAGSAAAAGEGGGAAGVADLKHAIQSKYKIAIQHQVLVVNGGECMAADRRVCTYSAGTDTNPIFLFNK
ncbi:RB1CC1 isoform 8, partial [Pan troglodytes]